MAQTGDVVIYHNDDQLFRDVNNGSTDAPAIVNVVWSPDCINITVICDCNPAISKMSIMGPYEGASEYWLSKEEYQAKLAGTHPGFIKMELAKLKNEWNQITDALSKKHDELSKTVSTLVDNAKAAVPTEEAVVETAPVVEEAAPVEQTEKAVEEAV